MKLVKIVLSILLVIGLTFSLCSCFNFGDVKVDKDGNVKIKGVDGEIDLGKAKWDSSKMFGLNSPKATLDSFVSSDGTTIYSFSQMKEKDAEEYINKIKESGFSYNTVLTGDYSFTGTNVDGKTISFSYDATSQGGAITAGLGTKPSEDDKGEEAIIGGTNKKWESEKVGGLPNPGVEVLTYWSVDGDASYTLAKIDDHLGYVEKIKASGFTVDSSVSEINYTYIYTAENESGDRISFSASPDASTITFEKND